MICSSVSTSRYFLLRPDDWIVLVIFVSGDLRQNLRHKGDAAWYDRTSPSADFALCNFWRKLLMKNDRQADGWYILWIFVPALLFKGKRKLLIEHTAQFFSSLDPNVERGSVQLHLRARGCRDRLIRRIHHPSSLQGNWWHQSHAILHFYLSFAHMRKGPRNQLECLIGSKNV